LTLLFKACDYDGAMELTLEKLNSATLREARIKAGLTQDDVAAIIGKTKGTVSHYENGEVVPPGDVLLTLLKHYKLIPEKFLKNLFSHLTKV